MKESRGPRYEEKRSIRTRKRGTMLSDALLAGAMGYTEESESESQGKE